MQMNQRQADLIQGRLIGLRVILANQNLSQSLLLTRQLGRAMNLLNWNHKSTYILTLLILTIHNDNHSLCFLFAIFIILAWINYT